jgi:hypothetical protein
MSLNRKKVDNMDIREQILAKQKEFKGFIESVDLQALRATYSREELKAFEQSLREITVPSLSFEISKLTDKMKKEEFPQLLSVHRYPLINEINFLTQSEKEALDKHLMLIRMGNPVYNLYRVVRDLKKQKMLEAWLLEKQIVEPKYMASCGSCSTGYISSQMGKEEKDALLADFIAYKDGSKASDEDVENLSSRLEMMCYDCEECVELGSLNKLQFKENLYLIADRDKSLDNV